MAEQNSYTDEELAGMSVAQIDELRSKAKTQEEQNRYANFEHRAYTREVVTENPVAAIPLIPAIPAYAATKAAGLQSSRSETSVEQMKQAAIGVGEGLAANSELAKAGKAVANFPWEKTWQEEVVKPVQKAVEAVKSSLPWDRVWNNEETAPSPLPVAPKVTPRDKVEDVFTKLIQAESKGVHMDDKGKLTTSKSGAQGITQLMPKTAKNPGFGIKGVVDQSEKEYLRVGKEYLGALHKKFDGDMEKVLAAYNWGLGNVQRALGKAERFGEDWKKELPTETKKYLQKILGEK